MSPDRNRPGPGLSAKELCASPRHNLAFSFWGGAFATRQRNLVERRDKNHEAGSNRLGVETRGKNLPAAYLFARFCSTRPTDAWARYTSFRSEIPK